MTRKLNKAQANLKVWTSTKQNINTLINLTGESISSLIHRLVIGEIEKLKEADKQGK